MSTRLEETPKSNETSSLITSHQVHDASSSDVDKARRLLYLSHFFAQFSEAAWQFALVLFLAAFTMYKSLLLISTYGLASGLSICMLGAQAGRFVDGSDRLVAASLFIWTENLSVLIATILCYLLLSFRPTVEVEDIVTEHSSWTERNFPSGALTPWSITLLIGIHFWGSLASVLDKGFLVAIERDWVVVMSHEAGVRRPEVAQKWLSETNVMMKQIDLACKVMAPAIAGFIISAFEGSTNRQSNSKLTGAALLAGATNVAALIVEYYCTTRIYRLVPTLAEMQHQAKRTGPKTKSIKCQIMDLPHSLKVYMNQSVSWAGLGLSLLYLNALTFGGLMTGYLIWRGMRLETVGIWRGISAAVGLLGTLLFIILLSEQHSSIRVCGVFFVSFFAYHRVGLWVFDISVTQLMQEFIPAGIRGQVGGTQESLNAFFQLLSFALGLIFPDPEMFHIYVSAGYFAVGLAAILFTSGIYARRNVFLTTEASTKEYPDQAMSKPSASFG